MWPNWANSMRKRCRAPERRAEEPASAWSQGVAMLHNPLPGPASGEPDQDPEEELQHGQGPGTSIWLALENDHVHHELPRYGCLGVAEVCQGAPVHECLFREVLEEKGPVLSSPLAVLSSKV